MKTKPELLERLLDYVNSRLGACSETEWKGTAYGYSITCEKGHCWKASYDTLVRQGSWCKKCLILTPEERKEHRRQAALKCARKPKTKLKAKERYERIRSTDDFKKKTKNWVLKKKFGITLDEFNKKIEEQDGACAICGLPLEPGDAVMDHCHQTGAIRGVLHRWCNSAIGFLDDSPALLRKALDYLEKYASTD